MATIFNIFDMTSTTDVGLSPSTFVATMTLGNGRTVIVYDLENTPFTSDKLITCVIGFIA